MRIGQRFKYKFPSPCPPGRIWRINPFCSEEDLHSCSHFAGDFVCVTLGTADCSSLAHPSILADKLSHPYRSVQAFPLLCLPHLQLSPLPTKARAETFITLDDRPLRMGWSPGSILIRHRNAAWALSNHLWLALLQSHQLISPGDFACFLFPVPHFSHWTLALGFRTHRGEH